LIDLSLWALCFCLSCPVLSRSPAAARGPASQRPWCASVSRCVYPIPTCPVLSCPLLSPPLPPSPFPVRCVGPEQQDPPRSRQLGPGSCYAALGLCIGGAGQPGLLPPGPRYLACVVWCARYILRRVPNTLRAPGRPLSSVSVASAVAVAAAAAAPPSPQTSLSIRQTRPLHRPGLSPAPRAPKTSHTLSTI
jgi:hypothetical protein